MVNANLNLPAKADNLNHMNDVIDTLHNFFAMIQVFDVYAWLLKLVDLIAGIQTLLSP